MWKLNLSQRLYFLLHDIDYSFSMKILMTIIIKCSPFSIGVAKAEAKNFTEAIRLFSRTLELDPNHKAAKRHLEQARLQLSATATTNSRKNNR